MDVGGENAERERISVRMHLCAGVYEGREREREKTDGMIGRKRGCSKLVAWDGRMGW